MARAEAPNSQRSGALSCQWLRNGEPIPGATSDILVVGAMSTADGGEFLCRAVNAQGSTDSQTAAVVVTARQGGFPFFLNWTWPKLHQRICCEASVANLRVLHSRVFGLYIAKAYAAICRLVSPVITQQPQGAELMEGEAFRLSGDHGPL